MNCNMEYSSTVSSVHDISTNILPEYFSTVYTNGNVSEETQREILYYKNLTLRICQIVAPTLLGKCVFSIPKVSDLFYVCVVELLTVINLKNMSALWNFH